MGNAHEYRLISIVIPTLNAEETLPDTLSCLVEGALDGLVRDVVVADGGSSDQTMAIADYMGCEVVTSERGRGYQLAAGAEAAKSDWLLFLHADTVLDARWQAEVAAFCASESKNRDAPRAGVFQFKLRDEGATARILETMVAVRCALFALPYGDQGLLIHRSLYDEIDGFQAIPLMEDVDIIRKIGRRRLSFLQTRAITSADRFKRNGYISRSARNLTCLFLYFAGVSPYRIAKIYS
ncbi:MAG: TIGR04283 family arsenosugar biosynthesis glycosyltransferase [Pseudomonadota bacterium]